MQADVVIKGSIDIDASRRSGAPTTCEQSFKPKPTQHWLQLLGLLVGVAVLMNTLSAAPNESNSDFVGAGTLYLRSQENDSIEAPRVHTDVHMEVTGIIARVAVRQRFQNPSATWAEGTYAFPLPENSAVDRMRMEIGTRVIVGEIREKAEAQKLYEQARDNGQHASVVHQQRPNLFRTAVANIGPHETVSITIEYLQIVEQQAGSYSLRFPLSITPRYSPVPSDERASIDYTTSSSMVSSVFGANDSDILSDLQPALADADKARQSVSFDIDIDAGVALKQVTSAYHAVNIDKRAGRVRVRLQDETVVPDHDFELTWIPDVRGEPATAMFHERTDEGEHVLLMFMPPQAESRITTPREVIFVIDTSGSMGGESIRQARAALLKGLDSLKPNDRFTVIQFNSVFECLFLQPVPATAEFISQARRYVTRLEATGGTEMLPALSAALAMRTSAEHLRQVVFMTDGAVDNEDQLMRAIHEQLGDARLFTIGIGSAPNGHFMRKAAQMGRGTFTYIGSTNEVDEKMSALLHKLTQPVLTNIELHWPQNAQPEYAPDQVSDLYAGEPVVITARLRGEVKGVLGISGRANGAWTRQLSLQGLESRGGVATLWARNRIGDLTDTQASGALDSSVREQVLPLALKYQLVTKYTSLVAVDHTPARADGEQLNSQHIANTKPQASNWPVTAYPKTATPAALDIIIGLLLLMLAAAWLAIEKGRGEARR